MEGAINQLDQPSQDVLMKYIYRGFELPKEAVQANLLTWHDKVRQLHHRIKKVFYQ